MSPSGVSKYEAKPQANTAHAALITARHSGSASTRKHRENRSQNPIFQQPARDIKARAVVAPLKQPVRTAVQFLLRPSSLIDVLTEQGQPEF